MHDPYAAFRIAAFRNFLLGSILVNVGTGIQGLALGWELYQRTGQALSLGLVGLMQAGPMILLSLPAGWLADRFDRTRVLALSCLGATATSLGLAWASWNQADPIWFYLLLALDSTALTLGRPARMALLPSLVPVDIFENAVAWRTSLFQVSGFAGPALGGFLIAWSIPACYLLAAATTVIFAALIATLPHTRTARPADPISLEQLFAGLRFVMGSGILLAAISLDLFAVLLGGAVYLLPIFASDILHVGEAGLGWLRAAPAAGAFCTAIVLAHRPPMKRAGRNLLLAVAGFGVATILFGLSTHFVLSLVLLFLTGVFDNVSVVIRHTLVQLRTPESMRGRVSAVNSIFIGSSNELGGFESGVVAQWTSPRFSVVSGGIGTLIVVGLTAWLCPALRRFGSLANAGPEWGLVRRPEDRPSGEASA